MSVFTPGRRWQPPFAPFIHESSGRKVFSNLEKNIKGPLFGCRMCGNCLLQETAFICPMECPKGLRNGPCGGSTSNNCYVDETRPCIWYKIFERAFKLGRKESLLEVLPPLDWEKVGTGTWGDIVSEVQQIGILNVARGLVNIDINKRAETLERVFHPIRQPEWWGGDGEYHSSRSNEPASGLEDRLRSGEFVVACEIAPPLSSSTDILIDHINQVKEFVSVINFTDCASATSRMSSWACSKIAIDHGAEPVMQIAARDRTRAGLQGDVLGASALGVRNILCITGDSPVLSPRPRGRMDINDLDSIQMLWILRRMRDDGRYLDGRDIKFPPKLFLGAAASPFSSEPKFQAIREHKKVNAGAQFFQTNLVYDIERMEIWLNELAKRNILDKVYILVGITPLKSLKLTLLLKDMPGLSIPENIIRRMEAADLAGNAKEEGVQIALELVSRIKVYEKHGIHGIHFMPVGWENIVPRIVTEAGLLTSLGTTKIQNN